MQINSYPRLPRVQRPLWRRMLSQWELYLFVLPVLIYLAIFSYGPMYGVIIAFKDFKPFKGYLGSDWVGMKHFIRLFGLRKFPIVVGNTVVLSVYSLLAGFPLPILLALTLNSCSGNRFKRTVQTITYAPHFISTVVLVGMILIFFSPSTGIVRNTLVNMGAMTGYLNILNSPSAFKHIYVWSGVWKSLGWSSIIYLGALSGVDPSLHEAAIVDGATKVQRILHIDVPSILPTIIILLIMNMGSVMSVGFEKVFLMQNSMNLEASEVLSTYVYKLGIKEGQYSFATAVNLFNSGINFVMLYVVNAISRRVSETSLW